MKCLDIGSRGGFVEDLLPMAFAVDAVGFEADKAECDKMNKLTSEMEIPWRSLKYLPIALGKNKKKQSLNIYSNRGCSSLLEADVELAESFSRGDYYQLEKTVEIETVSLDKVAEKYNLTDAVYMKIDVQGSEMDIINNGKQLLKNRILVVRIEVMFYPFYINQCTFKDLDGSLRDLGFIPMMFLEQHHWRRTTKVKLPLLSEGQFPYSRGQLMHGDVLYFKDPDIMPDGTSEEIEILLKASFIALAYGYVDHSLFIMQRPSVKEYLASKYDIVPEKMLGDVSRYFAALHLKKKWRLLLSDFKSQLKQSIGLFLAGKRK
ncbi:MAG: FkbM family methyltransferase [Deltaproteobacteria bacterium]|uniref:FkbM family methyltransferase n=1 Tax=Candidatus Zymogenus saltonus TaxID=2844893 RepID=A0A9D8KIP2_9DELT|nr:FkbM family methyltransferase [Candidatus Zymogenus saltonus]